MGLDAKEIAERRTEIQNLRCAIEAAASRCAAAGILAATLKIISAQQVVGAPNHRPA